MLPGSVRAPRHQFPRTRPVCDDRKAARRRASNRRQGADKENLGRRLAVTTCRASDDSVGKASSTASNTSDQPDGPESACGAVTTRCQGRLNQTQASTIESPRSSIPTGGSGLVAGPLTT